MFLRFTIIIILMILTFPGFSQQVVINEILSSNAEGITDEDGDHSDWIELYNFGQTPVNLSGYGLSDDPEEPFKWVFPQVMLYPDSYMLVFASDKNRTDAPVHWETVIDWGDTWRYFPGIEEPEATWKVPGFDASGWFEGPSGFGYGDEDDATVIFPVISCYIRKTFTVEDAADITHALLHVDFDDAFVAYLNGYEIARENVGEAGIPPGYQQTADTYIEAQIYQGGNPGQYIIENLGSLLYSGENVLAIQVHNYSQESSDMSVIPFLTLGMNTVPDEPQGTNELLTPLLPQMHTNFKISASGETVMLTAPGSSVADSVPVPELPADISYGRQPDGADSWYYFPEPTPSSMNNSSGYQSFAPDVIFSQPGGFYDATISLTLSGAQPGQNIYFTIDGSEPTEASMVAAGPFSIGATTIIRARILGEGVLPGKIITHSYFMNESLNLPVVSISSTPANFWDTDSGIYVMGNNAEPSFPYFGANFWEDWERPVNIEIFETDGTQALNSGAGVKIFGGWSRGFPQKSLALFARSRYGTSEFEYRIFSEKPIDRFEAFVLRNSGNDWGITMFRDALLTGLLKTIDLDYQAYRPAAVYINGEYWGLHNIREKVNEHFIAGNHPGVDPDNIDEIESLTNNSVHVIEGDDDHYQTLISFLENADISDPGNYDIVQSMMEVDNFISYQAAQIYFDNTDWPGNNIKFWRPKTPDGRWRWIIYDTDFGFGIWNTSNYENNTLAFALEDNGPDWPNPPWSTFMLRRLLENQEFKYKFINRFADFFNTIFKADSVINRINQMEASIEPEMGAHFSRWGGSVSEWQNKVEVLRTFANNRISYLSIHIMNQFGLNGLSPVTIDVNDDEYGSVQLNTINPEFYPWSGFYFNQIPVTVTAIPAMGYHFSHWSGASVSSEETIEITVDQAVSLTAHFEADAGSDFDILINEINYNSADNFNPEDWIEFYNKGDHPVDMGSWIFKDEEDIHEFVFSADMILNPGEFTVICRDTNLFKNLFPDVQCVSGQFAFGLSGGGELLRLYNDLGFLVDSLIYNDVAPWPPEADGNGPTLALKDPDLDNSLPQNWAASIGHGTPGEVNNVVAVEDKTGLLPRKFKIDQNYPNPFNPQTNIEFQIPENGLVLLEIFDIMGRHVQTLLRKPMAAGYHAVQWKPAAKTGSGIYFYRICVDDVQHDVKKMVFIK